MILEEGKVAVGFCDTQWGSGGKGKFNAYLALKEKPDFAISHNSVQASHIFVADDGFTYKFQHLPTSVVNPTTHVFIGGGASINLIQLLKEISDWKLTPDRLSIHPNAVVITDDDIEYERKTLQRIASTMTGNGAALGRKVMRHPDTKTVSDFEELKPFVSDIYEHISSRLARGQRGVLELAQGFDLSLDHSMVRSGPSGEVSKGYPFVTSRNCDPMTFVGMSGLSHRFIGSVMVNMRTFPIRVGDGSNNKVDGFSGVSLEGSNSGDHYPDQREVTWDYVTEYSGSMEPICEMTSLTKRVRRVFTFSDMQWHRASMVTGPNLITINYVNYLDSSISGKHGVWDLSSLETMFPKVWQFVMRIRAGRFWTNPVRIWLGTGPANSEVIELDGVYE